MCLVTIRTEKFQSVPVSQHAHDLDLQRNALQEDRGHLTVSLDLVLECWKHRIPIIAAEVVDTGMQLWGIAQGTATHD